MYANGNKMPAKLESSQIGQYQFYLHLDTQQKKHHFLPLNFRETKRFVVCTATKLCRYQWANGVFFSLSLSLSSFLSISFTPGFSSDSRVMIL